MDVCWCGNGLVSVFFLQVKALLSNKKRLHLPLEMKNGNNIHNRIEKVFVIQQNNSIYFCSSNMLAAYNFLKDNINPMDQKLLKCYKQYWVDMKKTSTLIIPSNCGQNFQFKRLDLFARYNSQTSTKKLLTT